MTPEAEREFDRQAAGVLFVLALPVVVLAALWTAVWAYGLLAAILRVLHLG